LLFAIGVSVLILSGIVVMGLERAPAKSEALAPLYQSADGSNNDPANPLRQSNRKESLGVKPNISATPVATSTKPSAMAITSSGAIGALTPTLGRSTGNTPTPIRVTVSTQKRSYVFYHGPGIYVRADAFAPLPLTSFPRPPNDNGRGLHWFPTTHQTRAVVDRFVPELIAMRISWVVLLQGMNDWDIIANDYLIECLISQGIVPVMRIDRPVGMMDYARLGWIVARYRDRGVRYFQIFNEPNVKEEWSSDRAYSPEGFVEYWVPAAEVIAANGGFPGFSPMSPQNDDSDLAFFQDALEELKARRRFDLANLMWVAVHNYGDFDGRNASADGFFRYRSYDSIVKQVLGGALPMIITEGGLGDAESMANMIAPMYRFVMTQREPYFFAFAPWLIGNAVGGGHDARWESAAWFTGTTTQVRARSVVEQAKAQ